jgi:hypothetical protein
MMVVMPVFVHQKPFFVLYDILSIIVQSGQFPATYYISECSDLAEVINRYKEKVSFSVNLRVRYLSMMAHYEVTVVSFV